MDERWRVRTNKEIQDILQWKDKWKIYKLPSTKMVWSCWNSAKWMNAKANCSSYNGEKGKKRRTIWKMEGPGQREFKYGIMEAKKQADSGQRPLGLEEDCIVGQGWQWNVVFEKAKNNNSSSTVLVLPTQECMNLPDLFNNPLVGTPTWRYIFLYSALSLSPSLSPC